MATVTRYFCLHRTSVTSVLLSRYVCSYTLFFYKNVVFPAQAENILVFMIICLSFLNSISDIVFKKIQNFSSYNNVQYYCFQSAEIKESGGSFSDNYY